MEEIYRKKVKILDELIVGTMRANQKKFGVEVALQVGDELYNEKAAHIPFEHLVETNYYYSYLHLLLDGKLHGGQ